MLKLDIQFLTDKANINSITTTNTQGVVQIDNKGVYLRSDKQLNVNCDVDSNPEANCEWVYGGKILEGSSCNEQFDISTSSLLKCKAKNSQYENELDEISLNVTVVNSDRKLIKVLLIM